MERFTFIGSLLCSLVPLLTIKKFFYRGSALHPWIFACLVYYPIVRIGILITCSILDSIYPGYIHYAYYIGFLPAFFVFRGGKHTRNLAKAEKDLIYNNKLDSYRANVLARIQDIILRISPSKIPDFSVFHRTDLQIATAVASLFYIRDKRPPFSEKECLCLLFYYHKALSILSNPIFDHQNTTIVDAFIKGSAKEFGFLDSESLYAYRYILLNISDPDLFIDERNKYYLDDPAQNS